MKVYFDNAATTQTRKEVIEEMRQFLDKRYGNASSLHAFGVEAREAVEGARDKAAKELGVKSSEVFFTSGATEADNLALKGAAFAARKEGKDQLVVSAIEHDAILRSAEWLESQGFKIIRLPVDEFGFVDVEKLKYAINDKTFLVSVMYANNEIGTIEPIKEIAEVCAEKNVPFHSDAVQAFGKIPLDLENVSMLSLSAHKIYGPKGVGLLVKREGLEIEPLLHGGGHEKGLRSGTENVAGIAGMGKAMELAGKERAAESKRQEKMRDKMIKGILGIPETRLNGHPKKRLPNNVNASFGFIEGEALLLRLDEKGIAAST
ncbi:MAG: cysteine desulfurase family protein, partial [Candidatus Diapherotrites archaeon]|nr:cysteine desulfurase family protein [Candidatus Diapherotrites archaeon]